MYPVEIIVEVSPMHRRIDLPACRPRSEGKLGSLAILARLRSLAFAFGIYLGGKGASHTTPVS